MITTESKILGVGIIDWQSGIFRISIDEYISEAILHYYSNDELIRVLPFSLILDIITNIVIIKESLIDAYGRNYDATEDIYEEKGTFVSKSWFYELQLKETNTYQTLCDLFLDSFCYLGSNIIIFDPYFIGNLDEDDSTRLIHAKGSQIAFLNAMIIHLFRYKWKAKFTIIGYNHRANSSLHTIYPLYKKYINSFVKSVPLCPNLIEFRYASKDFHNRYYLKYSSKDSILSISKPLIITNSIGNINEVDIVTVEDDIQEMIICSKCQSLFNQSKNIEEDTIGLT
jgi:hypothetical protein